MELLQVITRTDLSHHIPCLVWRRTGQEHIATDLATEDGKTAWIGHALRKSLLLIKL